MICTRCNVAEIFYKKAQLCKSCYDKERGKLRWIKVKNNPELKAIWNKKNSEGNKRRRRENPELLIKERGRCKRWYEKNKEYRKKYYDKYYKDKLSYHLERRRFYDIQVDDILRDKIYARAGGICENCHIKKYRLNIHHLDGNGKGALVKNNDFKNLALLCMVCHTKYHRGLLDLVVRGKKYSCIKKEF